MDGAPALKGLGVVFDTQLDGLRDFRACYLGGQREGQVDAGRHPVAGHDPARLHDTLLGRQGSVSGEGLVGAPVGGGGQPVEKSRSARNEGAVAD